MTCIVGVTDGRTVHIGADSAGVDAWGSLHIGLTDKVFRNRGFLLGFTTSFRMGQLLRWSFVPPEHIDGADTLQYMVLSFIPAVRDCLKAGGFAVKKDERESGGTFLVGYKGRLFRIEDDYQVGEPGDLYSACGSGESFARGALFATAHLLPVDRVRLALEAAEAHNANVRRPFKIERIPA